MSTTSASNPPVVFSADDALALVKTIGALTLAVNPAYAAGVSLVTGAASLLRSTVVPAIAHLSSHEKSVVEQEILNAESAAERLRVGAPPAALN